MKPVSHVVISISVFTVLYLVFRSHLLAFAAFLFGIFIDLDHLPDYFREHGFNLDVKRFVYFGTDYRYEKATIFLHSWELFLIYSVIVFISPVNEILFGVFIGYSIHLIFDQFGNLSRPLSYFFIYRWKNNFTREIIWRVESLGCK